MSYLSLGVLTVREAKSGEGRRMPLNNVVRKTLLRLHQERGQALTGNGSSSGERNGHVFSAPEGGYLYNLNRDWYPALRHADLSDLHFHDLRHTFASRLVMRGVDLYTVQTLLGHKTPAEQRIIRKLPRPYSPVVRGSQELQVTVYGSGA